LTRVRHRRLTAFRQFVSGESAGGVLLIVSAIAAVVWANSAAAPAYQRMLHWPLGVVLGARTVTADLRFAIDDGLMAIFFLLVGLEIRREVTEGRLATFKLAAAPLVAAIGGMVVPALIYVAFCRRDPAAMRGWAIPVATDIAFSLAVLRLLGSRVPGGLQVFLTALAIIDDLGAILVIAIFYTAGLNATALAGAAVAVVAMAVLGRLRVRSVTPYLALFAMTWALLVASGVHATLAGVATALAVPMRTPDSVGRRLEHGLNPIVAYIVLPLFGLFNAGLDLSSIGADTFRDPVVPGIFVGLLVGKQIGVFGALRGAVAAGIARVPHGLSWTQLYAAAILCGIGFTMSLFIGNLSFPTGLRTTELKLAVFAASLASAFLGAAMIWFAARARPAS